MQIAHSLIEKSATYAIAVHTSIAVQICKVVASKCARKFATLASKLGKVGEGHLVLTIRQTDRRRAARGP